MTIRSRDILLFFALATFYTIAFSIAHYEFLYLFRLYFFILILVLSAVLLLATKRAILVVLCFVLGAYLGLLPSPTYPLINKFRIAVSDVDDLPMRGEIVHWSQGWLYSIESFFYLMKTRETEDEKIKEALRSSKKRWLADDDCRTDTLSRLGDYVLIWSRCG